MSEDHHHHHEHGADCGCGHEHHEHSHAHEHGDKHGFLFYLELLTLVLWGAVLIAFMVNGRVVNFLADTGILREQALIGGVVLLVLATFNFITRNQTCDCGHDHSHDHRDEGHHHHHHEAPSALSRLVSLGLLAAPLGYAWAKSPDSYSPELQSAMANSVTAQVNSGGRSMVRRRGNEPYTAAIYREQLGAPATGPIPIDTQSFFLLGGDSDMRKIMENEPVTLTGRVVKNTIGRKANRLRMYDLEMTCCAADARPFSFPLQFKESPGDYVERGWYKITGTIAFEEERGGNVSMVNVEKMELTTRPN
jgi:hypothetical protein